MCRELLSRERTYPVVNTVADSCGCLLAGNCVSVVRQRASFFRPITMPLKKRNVPDDEPAASALQRLFYKKTCCRRHFDIFQTPFYRSRNSRIPLILPYGKTRADGNLFNNIPCCPITNISVNPVFAARQCLVCSVKKCFRTQKRRQKRGALR